MSTMPPVPVRIAQIVNEYVERELGQVEQYDNREHLDTSAVWELHALSRVLYAAGWADGFATAAEVERGMR